MVGLGLKKILLWFVTYVSFIAVYYDRILVIYFCLNGPLLLKPIFSPLKLIKTILNVLNVLYNDESILRALIVYLYGIFSLIFSCKRIIVFICTDAWAPICIFLHVSGQNESAHIKTIDTLFDSWDKKSRHYWCSISSFKMNRYHRFQNSLYQSCLWPIGYALYLMSYNVCDLRVFLLFRYFLKWILSKTVFITVNYSFLVHCIFTSIPADIESFWSLIWLFRQSKSDSGFYFCPNEPWFLELLHILYGIYDIYSFVPNGPCFFK